MDNEERTENNEKIVVDYYNSKQHQEFYKNLWGGESIHIGIYDDLEEELLENANPETIKKGGKNKCELMWKLIRTYCKDINIYKIADLGSGYGGTARYIYQKIKEKNNTPNIDCYDLSFTNCIENTKKNIKCDFDISVFNRSFCDTASSANNYFIIISEDAFIHVSDKTPIFEEVFRILFKGYFIFSDIILTENANMENINEVYERIGISKMESFSSYKKLGEDHGFHYCNFIPYNENMLKHYSLLESILNKNGITENNNILKGVQNWIKHIKNGNITSGIFIFKKN